MLELREIYPILLAISIISGCLMLALAFYVWRKYWLKRRMQPARYLIFLMLLMISWMFSFALGLVIPDFSYKFFLEQFAYIGTILLCPTWFIFALQWTGKDKWLTTKKFSLIYIIPLLFLFLIFTDGLHHLIFTKVDFIFQGSILLIDYGYSDLWWLLTLYCYFLILIGVFINCDWEYCVV